MASKDTLLSTLATALRLVKATPEESLRDIEVIDSIVDGVTPDDTVPGKTELLTIGPATAARGLQAETDIKRNSDLQPQQDVTLAYQELDGRMSDMAKAVNKLIGVVNTLAAKAVKKAEDEKEEMKQNDKDAEEATEKAHRKARIAVRKAEASDEEEADMIMDSAEKAIKAFDAAISKAEDEAESDEDEKKTEKARSDLKALRASMKALRDRAAAAKAAATPVAAPAVKAEEKEEKKDDADDMLKSLLAQKGITINELISQIQGATIRSAPTFSKAIQSNSDTLMTNIDAAFDEGRITQGEYQSAMQILSQKALLSSGALTESQFGQAFDRAPSTVKQLFVPATV